MWQLKLQTSDWFGLDCNTLNVIPSTLVKKIRRYKDEITPMNAIFTKNKHYLFQ